MSWYASAWAEKAPVGTVYERAILTYLAHRAKKDGTNCYPSTKTLADFALCDKRTVQRHLDKMSARGLIAEGDQRVTEHLRADRRPTVYDILIPHDWYSDDQLEDVNEDRAERGLPPLSPEERPRLTPPPKSGRAERSDKGKKNPNRGRKSAEHHEEPDSETGCLSDTPQDDQDEQERGDSQTPRRGVSQTRERGVSLPPKTVPGGETPPGETPPSVMGVETSVRPSGEGDAREADGRTDEENSNEEQATALMYEDQAVRHARRLGPWEHQRDQIHAALVQLLVDTDGDVRRVRGYFLAKLHEARTVSYAIDGLTAYANEVHHAEPEMSPAERAADLERWNQQLRDESRLNGTDVGNPNAWPNRERKETPEELLKGLGADAWLPSRLRA